MSKKYLFTIVVFILWIFGFYLASDLAGGSLGNELSRVNPMGILFGLVFYVIAVGIGVLILYKCLRYVGLKPPLQGVAKAWVFGSFIDNISPTIMPLGEATMAYFLEKFYRISYTKSLAAIGMYVSSWGISVSVYSALAVIITQLAVGIPQQFLIPVIVVISIFTLITFGWFLLLMNKGLVERIVCRFVGFYNFLRNHLKSGKVTIEKCVFMIEFEKSYTSLEFVLKNKKLIVESVLMFVIPQLCHVLCIYSIIVFGFGENISFFNALIIHIVASVAGLISFIPSGLGVYEIVAGSTLASTLTPITATAAVLLYRLIFVWSTNLIGGFIGVVEGIENPGEILKK